MTQARRRSSVTGGGEGQKKYLERAQINFSLKCWSEDQKRKKKVFIPNYAPCIRAVCLLSGHNSRSGGEGGKAGTFIAWWGRRNLILRFSVLAHKFRGEDQKKGFRLEILAFILAFSRVFRPGIRLYSRLEDRSSILGGTGPEMDSSDTGTVTFFWGTFLAWRDIFLALGSQAVIWGARPQNATRWRRACYDVKEDLGDSEVFASAKKSTIKTAHEKVKTNTQNFNIKKCTHLTTSFLVPPVAKSFHIYSPGAPEL